MLRLSDRLTCGVKKTSILGGLSDGLSRRVIFQKTSKKNVNCSFDKIIGDCVDLSIIHRNTQVFVKSS